MENCKILLGGYSFNNISVTNDLSEVGFVDGFKGSYSRVRIYDCSLNEGEIAQLFQPDLGLEQLIKDIK